MRKGSRRTISLAFCDGENTVYEYPGREPAFRTARSFVTVDPDELIPLPYGSVLFTLPERYPVSYDGATGTFITIEDDGLSAASAFLSSGHLRTYLPAYEKKNTAPVLPLWAYCGVVLVDGQFFVPALRIDPDPRSDPELHENEEELEKAIGDMIRRYPNNRLVTQLTRCATEYRCLCARNFFLSRYEAPVPTAPSCNSRCVGCLSYQKHSGFPSSQERLTFRPTPAEIAEIILHHVNRVDAAVASFGQGCEGEPLLRGSELAQSIAMVRRQTARGTLHLNTNGSLPEMVSRLIDAGLDSIRISINSPREEYYTRYFRPRGFHYRDVLRSIDISLAANIFVSLHLFFFPGVTDAEDEVELLDTFLKEHPVNMIQTRNLNIDPDLYLDAIAFEASQPIGIRTLIDHLREQFPDIRLGYYNPPREKF